MRKSLYAGFDLGGTQLKYGLIDEDGTLIFKDKAPTPASIDGLLKLLKSLLEEMKKRGKNKIAALGFGFPGIFSLKERKIFQSPNYPGLDNFNLFPALSRFLDVPFWVDNDANLAAFGEWKCGAGKGAQSLVLLTIGTGIGSGIILDGKLWHGACGYAGELGHVVVHPDGEKCNCGINGCLESEASAPRIVKHYLALAKTNENISAEEVYIRAKNGDQAARHAFARAGYYLGIGLGIVLNMLNPDKILLGGGVMTTGEFIFGPALEEARKRSYKASFECCAIQKASLGNDAGLIGAASWAQDQVGRKSA
jgi:glucokinase